MSRYLTLLNQITDSITNNGNGEITGKRLQEVLTDMVNSLGENVKFIGVVKPNSVFEGDEGNVFAFATEAGTYSNFGGITVGTGEIAVLMYNGAWKKYSIDIVTEFDLENALNTISNKIDDFEEATNKKIDDFEEATNQTISGNAEYLNNLLGLKTLEKVNGYTYIGMINQKTKSVISIDENSKVFYLVVDDIDFETLFGIKAQENGYTIVKSVDGVWVVEDLGIPFDLRGSLNWLNTKISQVENTANSKVAKQQSAGQGNVVMFGKGGEVADSNIEASNVAKQNGYYESMIVGASRNLAGNNIITAKYTYRPTAGTADVADGVAKISSVKGNTIVWNQLIDYDKYPDSNITNGITFNKVGNGKFSASGTATNNAFSDALLKRTYLIPKNHVYYVPIYSHSSNTNIQIYQLGENGESYLLNTGIGRNTYPVEYFTIRFRVNKGVELNNFEYCLQLFDLTQMFGEGNEPTLEEFEAMFPDDYYEYNEGELKSIEDFQIKSVGFNQWDEESVKKNTSLTDKDGIEAVSDSFWSSQFIKVLPNTEYYISHIPSRYYGLPIHEYDINFNHIAGHAITNITQTISNEDQSGRFVTNSNTCYLRFVGLNSVGYRNTCINLSHSGIRDGEYEPYQEDILPINISTIKDENGEQLFPNGLCSAGTAHDELVYDKGIGKWKAVKRIGSVDMGSLDWVYNDGTSTPDNYPYGFNQGVLNNRKPGRTNVLQVKYDYNVDFKKDKMFVPAEMQSTIYVVDSSYSDAASLKQSLQGQILYYELVEPVEVVLDDFTSNYKVSDWGTEEILMNSTPIIPVIYDVEYALNAVDTLRNMPTNYISKESLDAFLSALGSAMSGTWTAIYNETNGRYDFSFSANASATELTEE